jgi:hypothetical protein
MNTIDMTREITAPTGVQLTAIDALRNAADDLHSTDAECAYVRAARALLDAVLTDIDAQTGSQA